MYTTPFTHLHIALGAKMAEFAGYNMPIQYTGITDEHLCVRQRVGMFDVSHMAEFIVRGPNAQAFLQYVSSNDVSKLYEGKIQYSCLMNDQNGIVDDMLVYNLQPNSYMLVVNASNRQKDWDWLLKHCPDQGVEMIDISNRTALLAVQGPLAAQTLQGLTDIDLANMEYYTFKKGKFAGIDNVLVSATGYTGAGGFEIYFDNEHAELVWNAILQAGQPNGLQLAGLGARDTLRLEKGYCLYGNDINDTTSPPEAGLGWVVQLNKPTDFLSKGLLQAQKAAGLSRKLVGIELTDKGVARHGYPIINEQGEIIGEVTSGTQSPLLKKSIALGYVATQYAKTGTTIYIDIRQKPIAAVVTKIPFV